MFLFCSTSANLVPDARSVKSRQATKRNNPFLVHVALRLALQSDATPVGMDRVVPVLGRLIRRNSESMPTGRNA